ncbi:MAG TPA: nucleotide sugar dehydrogenase [Candidatus Latescibacteria bacterium]|nr:nucleotide sugar dehydrogenase [Candidatus Latescibacterota bacterium]
MGLEDKIREKRATVGVIGLGYVGLPLSVEIARAGFQVVGFETDPERIEKINAGRSYITDVLSETIENLVAHGTLKATGDMTGLKGIDVKVICVPTPLNDNREPELTYVKEAADNVAKSIAPGEMIVLESTTYPGTTEEILQPRLESTGLKAGNDFYLAFSPERVDPGNKRFSIKNTPKVVGGITKQCTKTASLFYRQFVKQVIPVSSTRVAEMTKLLENIYRAVNIALVNELTLLCDRMGIDVWEVIDAASTKPFGFTKFTPGPGIGGHCIPLDPFYLAWKAREYDFNTKFIELAGEINQQMPYFVVAKISEALNSRCKSLKDSRVLVLGVTYKKDVPDIRMSPALKVIRLLQARGADVSYHDPFVVTISSDLAEMNSIEITEEVLSRADCTVITTDHSSYDWDWIVANSRLIVDTKNATRHVKDGSEKIVRL